MQITWYGHAAFLLEATRETPPLRIILDPYREDVGRYLPVDDEADIVAISHENLKYHSYVDGVRGRSQERPEVVDGLALLETGRSRSIGGAEFTATRVWENEERLEPIAMVGVALEGIRVLHMGDCGHRLSPEEVTACGRVDVLLALAGGKPTLDLPDLVDFITALSPRIVLPMHFGNDKVDLNLLPVDELLRLTNHLPQRHFDTPTVSISPETLPASTEIWVLPPAR